jgi:outer membrane protein OmpA-like peptidoglycan-associated protein
MKQKRIAGIALVAAALVASGCATKKYVGDQVAAEDAKTTEKVAGVQGQVEQAQMELKKHDERITATSKTAQDALDRAMAAGKLAEGKFLYQTVLSDDKVKFPFNKSDLSNDAKAMLDSFSDGLKSQNKNVYVEIQGHTDNIGGDDYNLKLGEDRAEAVRRYLSTKGVALHRMSVISYGKTEPVADNKTKEGRAQNRRVVLVVLQ